jgi:hypothetical protein
MADKVVESDWSSDIEKILNDIRQNAVILSEFHNMKYFHLKSYLKYFRIPCIILSAFNSVFAVGLSSFMDQGLVSVINCIISLICGIIVSIELYMQIESSMREEVISCKNYYLLSVDIQKVLMLERGNRQVKGKVFLDKCFTEYCKLYENSGLLKKQIKDSLTPLAPELLHSTPSILAITNGNGNSNIETNTSKKVLELTKPIVRNLNNDIENYTINIDIDSKNELEDETVYEVPQIKMIDKEVVAKQQEQAIAAAQEQVVSNVNKLANSFGNLRNRFEKKTNKAISNANNQVNNVTNQVTNKVNETVNTINNDVNTLLEEDTSNNSNV